MDVSQSEHYKATKEPPLGVTYLVSLPITFVASLIFGIFMVWVPSLSPWMNHLSPISQEILRLSPVRERYEVSTAFCGVCGDRYLLTLELFILMALAYLALFCFVLVRRVMQESNVRADLKPIQNQLMVVLPKVLGTALLACLFFGAMLWTLLFSAGFVRPNGSASDYSMFNYSLLLLVNIAFHLLLLFLVPAVEMLAAITRLALPTRRNGKQ
jgi:hypothetical protein